jgi:chromosome segregation ATPase
MNTLTAIEAERVLQILRLASDRIHIMSYLSPTRDDELIDSIENPSAKNALEKQWTAEELLRRGADISSSEMGGKDIALLKRVHKCTRNTCRILSAERTALQSLMERPEYSRDSMSNFIRYLNELKSQVYQKLTTTVEDEAANRTQLHDLGERERLAEESRDALQAKLNDVREEKDKVTFSLDQALRKLQFELHDLTHLNKVETESVNREMAEAISKATADHELRMKQLSDQVDGLERQMTEVMDRNKEEEQRLRKDKSRAEAALSSRVTVYDEDMLARQETINSLEAAFTEEAKEYAVLKEYFDKVDADLGRQREEEDIIQAVVRRQDFAMGVMERAAIKIQSCIRAKIARVEVEKVRAKSKKGKKGKKGKK